MSYTTINIFTKTKNFFEKLRRKFFILTDANLSQDEFLMLLCKTFKSTVNFQDVASKLKRKEVVSKQRQEKQRRAPKRRVLKRKVRE